MITALHHREPDQPDIAARLLTQVRAGDRGAFAELVRTHQAYAYALAMRFVWDHADAEDIVQESFLRVWQHGDAFREGMKFTTWLYTIVTRLSLDRIRKKRRWGSVVLRSDGGEREPAGGGAEDVVDSLQRTLTAALVRDCAAQLPEAQRIVFTLRDLQDLSVEETGQITGMSAALIKAHLYHARKRIRGLMRRHGIHDGR